MDEQKTYNQDESGLASGNDANIESRVTIPVIQEELVVGKKVIETGKVRIVKTVTEQQEMVDIPLVQEEIHVERVAVNQYVDTPPPAIRYEGDVTIIPVVKEVLVVEKRLLLVEELRVTKTKVETNETQEVNVRSEDIKIERIKTDMPGDTAI